MRSLFLAFVLTASVAAPTHADDIAVVATDNPCPIPEGSSGFWTRWAGSAADERQAVGYTFVPSIGADANGEILTVRAGANGFSVFRMNPDGTIAPVFDLPASFSPSSTSIFSRRNGDILVLGDQRVVIRQPSGNIVIEPLPGAWATDLDGTGCILIKPGGGHNRPFGIDKLDLCAANRQWDLWLPSENVRTVVRFAPGNRLLAAEYGRILLLDASSGATLRTYPVSALSNTIALSPSGRSFWVIPTGSCDGHFDNIVREYEIATGRVLSQRAYILNGYLIDEPLYAAVRNGWRAAVSDDFAPLDVPAAGGWTIFVLAATLAAMGLRKLA